MILIPRERPSRRRAGLKRALLAALLALGGHGVFLLVILFLSFLQLALPPLKRPPSKNPVVIRGLSAEHWAQNRGDAPKVESDDRTASRPRPDAKWSDVR